MRSVLLGILLCCGPVFAAVKEVPLPVPEDSRLEQVRYNNPGLVVDLGVGLWAHPLPMDYTGNGHLDLLVLTPDTPYNGVYLFENPGEGGAMPVFKPAVRIGEGPRNPTVSYPGGNPVVTTPNASYPDFLESAFEHPREIGVETGFFPGDGRVRANQWTFVDYDGDGVHDLIIGIGYWGEYGWDDAYNEDGEWTNGPLRGYVYWLKNTGTDAEPVYAEAEQIMAGEGPLDVFGAPSPNFADWSGNGALDIICGEFLDGFTYFENIGTRTEPRYAPGRVLSYKGEEIRMDLQMLRVVALDWTRNGHTDLIVGQEDGRVALLESTGEILDGMPQFLPPRWFQQEAEYVKIGVLATPVGVDWDDDGHEDLIVGDTAGYLNFVKNLDGGDPPRWAPPVYLEAEGEVIRIQAGPNGSIQGPAEAKWGYTAPCVADWNHNGLPDILINSIWGKILWYENIGTRTEPKLKAAQPIEVAWEGPAPKPAWNWWDPEGNALVTQWRTTPFVIDLNENGLNDLVMLDTEGYLAFYERVERNSELILLPPKRIFLDEDGAPLRLNERDAGGSGRRKFVMVDWDGDGRLDLLLNSQNMDFLRNIAEEPGVFQFRNEGPVDSRLLAGHTTAPGLVDWNRNGIPDLLIGAEDGFLYHLENPLRN